MRRLIPFTVILGTYTYLASRIAEQLGYGLDRTSFWAAIAVATLTGFTWFLVSGWWSAATRPYRPQTVTQRTQETPYQIGCAAVLAVVALVVTMAVIVFMALIVACG